MSHRIKKYQLDQLIDLANKHLDEPWAPLAIDAAIDLQTARDTVASILEDRIEGRPYNHLMQTHEPLSWDTRTWIHHKLLDLILGTATRTGEASDRSSR